MVELEDLPSVGEKTAENAVSLINGRYVCNSCKG